MAKTAPYWLATGTLSLLATGTISRMAAPVTFTAPIAVPLAVRLSATDYYLIILSINIPNLKL
jgi:hypothetical protein